MISILVLIFLYRSTAYLASACVYWRFLGDQLNPLIRPLMDALKKESDPLIQVRLC
jgi:hypothetical protein